MVFYDTATTGLYTYCHSLSLPDALPISLLLGRHVVGGSKMSLQHLQLLAVFETDDVLVRDRLLDRHRRAQRLGLGLAGTCRESHQGTVDGADDFGDLHRRNAVVSEIGGHHLGRHTQKVG